MQKKYKYLSKNVIIFAISSFGTKFLSFLLVPLYTNVLTTAEYGTADIITTTATLMIYIFTINIADAVLRFAIDRMENQSEVLAYSVRTLIVGSLILIFVLSITYLSEVLAWDISYYIFIFLYYLSLAFYQIVTNFLRAVDQVRDAAIAGIISTLCMLLGNIILLVIVKTGVNGYLTSLILGPAIASVYCIIKIKLSFKEFVFQYGDKKIQLEMIRYCIPLIFNNVALWITAFLDKYFVTAICGYSENGVYSISYKIPTILSTCYQVFSQAWNLSAIREFDKSDQDGFFSKTYGFYSSVIVVVCSGLILMNIPMAKILYVGDFFEAWKYSSILLIFSMFNALTIFLGSVFVAVKKSNVIAITTLVAAGTNAFLNVILIPYIGVYGAAIATVISYIVIWVIRFILSRKYIQMKVQYVKDIIIYGLLIVQVILEHIEGHCYIGQILIFFTITIICHEHWKRVCKIIMNKISLVR